MQPGVYAAQAFHDENMNDKVDRNVLGLPTVGIGFSNDAPFRFGERSVLLVSEGLDGE